MGGFFTGVVVAIALFVLLFIATSYTNQTNRESNEKESAPFTTTVRANWRLYKNCWKFHIIPFLRLKYKLYEDARVKHFDITFGWLFLFVRVEFEKPYVSE